MTYEIALDLFESQIVWIRGPFKAGLSDSHVFQQDGGLGDKIPDGKKIIADNGYQGLEKVSAPNPYDDAAVKRFKERARARHETVNSRIKNFRCVSETFRHGEEKHQIMFEAVCVIVQYDMENGKPLFDI